MEKIGPNIVKVLQIIPQSNIAILTSTNCILIISAISLPCLYEDDNWIIDNKTCKGFKCSVRGKFEVKSRNTVIDGIKRKDPTGYPQPENYADPSTLWIDKLIMWYIPKGLETYFAALISLTIMRVELKELKQADLKVFPNLTFLNLNNNQIEVLGKDLFKFNPKLQGIMLNFNLIKYIDENILNDMKELKLISFGSNDCINQGASKRDEVMTKVKNAIRNNCQQYGQLQKTEVSKKTGTQHGKYFWIWVGCGVIVGIFVICAVSRIIYGIFKKA
ncbi:unnamed protein product [Chironomus riparius]|uniref:Uncharacterized protein n=1 Tax=Chironomus riparius TaxID=315576 RepID=A0A9N9WZV9_9DIPT|nr:unnamed protein product [Chironomus riparius]